MGRDALGEIQEVRKGQLDRSLRGISILGLFFLAASLLRVLSLGWHWIFWVHIGVYAAVLGTTLLRRHLSFPVRAWILIAAVFALGATALAAWGLATPAVIAFFVCCMISSLAFGYRTAVFILILGIVTTLMIGGALLTGIVLPVVDLETYQNSLFPWILMATSLVVAAGLMISALSGMDRRFEDLVMSLDARTKELFSAYEELKKLDETKDAFISGISHELRTPLTSIRSFSEILLEYPDEDPAVRNEFLKTIKTESDRLARVINDLLDLSAMRKGAVKLEHAPVAFKEAVQETIRQFEPDIREKSLRVEVRIPAGLPTVSGDPERVRQLLMNLLSNAVKFSQEGAEISIVAEPFRGKRRRDASDWLRITVSDSGPGIDEEDLPHVFEPFYQKARAALTDKPRGAGLGLAISKHIVESHGGDIWLESRRGEGTRVHFTLPIETMADPAGRDQCP